MAARARSLAVLAIPVAFGLLLTELSVDHVVTECRHAASGVVCTNTKEGRFSREVRGAVTLEPPVSVELSVETGSNHAITWTNHTVHLAGGRNKMVFSSSPDASKAAADVERLRTFVKDDGAPPAASRVEHDWPASLVVAMWVAIAVVVASAALLLLRGRSRKFPRT